MDNQSLSWNSFLESIGQGPSNYIVPAKVNSKLQVYSVSASSQEVAQELVKSKIGERCTILNPIRYKANDTVNVKLIGDYSLE